MVLDRSIEKSDADRKLFDNIARYDCHVISVANADGEFGPIFSYSIGMPTSIGAPELLIVGLVSKLAHSMINLYRDDIKKGRKFSADAFYSGLLDGFDVLLIEADQVARKEYAIWADWYHERTNFPLYQCVWPSTSGIWPWQTEASEEFKQSQPILGTISESIQ